MDQSTTVCGGGGAAARPIRPLHSARPSAHAKSKTTMPTSRQAHSNSQTLSVFSSVVRQRRYIVAVIVPVSVSPHRKNAARAEWPGLEEPIPRSTLTMLEQIFELKSWSDSCEWAEKLAHKSMCTNIHLGYYFIVYLFGQQPKLKTNQNKARNDSCPVYNGKHVEPTERVC